MGQAASIVGQVLGHYRVLEPIGAGGMGMVFRASDEQLERDVAIKVLPPGLLADESARKRFRREALTLAKLNHPNIGTVYEFGSQNDLDFLVMEYVGGVAVDAKLSGGPLPQKELLRLGFQLADGLANAHDHGVIHRDLKPANLRLTEDNRLKILDFGLAQFVRQDTDLGVTASMSEDSKVTGTLPYMSPEQLRSEVVDQRSDIWAAGAVLYELGTGHRPFPQSQVPLLIDAILNRDPKRPSELNPKLSPGVEMAILKCLDKDPERRYQSVRELRVDLDRLTMPISGVTSGVSVTVPAPPSSVRVSTKLLAGIASAIVLLILAAGSYLYFHGRGRGEVAMTPRRRTVAVLNLKNATSRPEAAWLSTALPEMLTTELGAGEKLRTITGEEVAQMKLNLSLPDSDILVGQALTQVGKTLGADLVVLGSYVDLANGQLRVDLHLQDVAGGETLLSVAQTGNETDLFNLIKQAGAQLREKCNAGEVTAQDEAAVRASLPSTTEASKLYAEGLAKLRVKDGMAARDLLQKAVEADPNHALAHSALAAAYSLLGYDEKARLAAKSAYDLSTSLSREEKLLTEARYRETSKEWNNAAEIYRTLFGFFPDNLEYGLMLAHVQARGGRGKDALATVDSLRRPPLGSQDPRIDLAASEAARFIGDFKQSAAYAGAAAEKARELKTKLVVARALYQKGFALENAGDPNGAMTAVDEAGKIYESVGDRFGLASTMEVTGQVLSDRGDYPSALAKFREELAVSRAVENRRAEASALNNMGSVLAQQGNSLEARQMFEKSASIFREISDLDNLAQTQLSIAGIKMGDGDLAGSKKALEDALSTFRELGNQNAIANALSGLGSVLDMMGDSAGADKVLNQAIDLDRAVGQSNPATDRLIALGDTLQHLGDLPNSRKNYESALAIARAAGDKSTSAYALFGLGSLELKAANLAEARKDYDEALSLRKELGEKDTINATVIASADLAIEEGHPDAAEIQARQAQDGAQAAHRNDDQLLAAATLAEALLAENKRDEASKALAKVAPMAAQSQNLSVQLAFALGQAQVKAAEHETGPATAIVRSALAKATKSGYLGSALECRLVILELASRTGKSPAVRAQIEQLQKEAKDKGFERISRKAGQL